MSNCPYEVLVRTMEKYAEMSKAEKLQYQHVVRYAAAAVVLPHTHHDTVKGWVTA